ncbi:SH3 domain-containing protein [Microbulbifer epialgicus]|uniref:SH3 domain-containing protein n=1 Tax=Microbulbifer epialgicus TaxID=393907 RepID=A0ABV4NVK7_9GAMM
MLKLHRYSLSCLLTSAVLFSCVAIAQESATVSAADSEKTAIETSVLETPEAPSAEPQSAEQITSKFKEEERAVPTDAELVTVGNAFINIYRGPGRGYPIFHVAEYGEKIWLLKRRTDWVKVLAPRNKTGWVRVEDLQEIYGEAGELVRVPLPDFRDVDAGYFYLGFSYGDFAGANSMGATLAYQFTANLSAELRATQAVGEFSDSQIYQMALVHQPFPHWRLSPYFLLGAGLNITAPNATIIATEDRQDTVMLAGLGLKTYLSRRFAIKAEYANHYLLTSRENNQEIVEWKLGFDVYL